MDKEQIKLENEYFLATEKLIEKKLNELNVNKENLKAEVLETRRDMYNNAPTVVRNFIDVAELSSYDESVKRSESAFERNEEEIRRLLKMQESPYFARIDFSTASGSRSQSVYIGRYSLRDEESFKLFVIDWRAPMASLYYNYDVGKGEFEVQGCKRAVDITLKRQFKIENGVLSLMYDTNSSMYDEILGRALSENTENKLKVIIGSIQKEQNSAIRSDLKNSCLIYGLAGSGKTSVGLHRLAYLLYHNRDTIKSENILIISNNSIFGSYISGVLPDLGEKPAENMIFHELLSYLGNDKYDIEDYYDQLEALERNKKSTRAECIKVKYSHEFINFLCEHFKNYNFLIPDVFYKDEKIISKEIISEKWVEKKYSSFKARYEMLKEIIKKAIEDYFFNNKENILRNIESESESFLTHRELISDYKKLKLEYLNKAVFETEKLNRLSPDMQLCDLYEGFTHNNKEAERLYLSLQGGKINYEDALLLLFIKIVMGYISPVNTIKHIVIDEAQDYCPLQLYILKYLFPKCTFTLLSDVSQAVSNYTSIESYGDFDKIFGQELNKIKLDKCYRSSSDINALAFKLLDIENGGDYSYFERKLKKPKLILKKDINAVLENIYPALSKYNTTAIITNSIKEAKELYNKLDKKFGAELIDSPEKRIKGKLMVIPLIFSKGLEFDSVLLIDSLKSNKNYPIRNKRVYLGATRALHQLYFIESEAIPEEFDFVKEFLEI